MSCYPNEGTVAAVDYARFWRVRDVAIHALKAVGHKDDANPQHAAHLIQHIAAYAAGNNDGAIWGAILREIAEGLEAN